MEMLSSFVKFIFLTLVTGLLFGAVFWIIWGHKLHYNIYANDEFWYSEEFNEFGKTIITVGLSLLFGICVSAIVFIMQKLTPSNRQVSNDKMNFKQHTVLILVLVGALLSYTPPFSAVAEAKQNQAPLIRPSNLLEDVRGRKKQQPNISSKDLAEIANKLLEEKGFDYDFVVCDVFGRDLLKRLYRMSPSSITYSYKMTQSGGKKVALRFISSNPSDGLCGECFSHIPTLQVTKQEMLVVSGGQRYQLKRPAAFYLDEAELVDETMRKVLRTWQLPFQTIPIGISPEGTKLY